MVGAKYGYCKENARKVRWGGMTLSTQGLACPFSKGGGGSRLLTDQVDVSFPGPFA